MDPRSNQFKSLLQIILVLLLGFYTEAGAQIVQTNSVDKIKTYISGFDSEDTLVLFDIDYVLLTPKDLVLRYAGEQDNYRSKQLKSIIQDFKEKEVKVGLNIIPMSEYLISKILASCEVELVSKKMLDLVNSLKSRKMTVIGFTANSRQKYGVIPNEGELHLSRLKFLGYKIENNGELLKGNFPDCVSRVVFTNKQDKGLALLYFLKNLNIKYKNIVFIDDRIKNLNSVQNSLKSHSINYLGVHYTKLKDKNEILNKNIADKQFQILRKEHVWLSDDEAAKRLNSR